MNMRDVPTCNESILLERERSQSKIRLFVCLFMGAYFVHTGHYFHPLYLGFIAYTCLVIAITARAHSHQRLRVVSTLLIDNFFTLYGLHITQTAGIFLFLILIQITFGYALRFGRFFLWFAVGVACTGISVLYFFSSYWHSQKYEIFAFVLGVPFIAFYIDHLTVQLRNAMVRSQAQADANEKLLIFVSHDIRTQLQSLLTTTDSAYLDSAEPITRRRLRLIEQTIRSLGRITTQFVEEDSVNGPNAVVGRSQVATIEWMAEIAMRFTEVFRENGTRLTFELGSVIVPRIGLQAIEAERLLLNALTNATRYSQNGSITIQVSCEISETNKATLWFEITNIRSDDQKTSTRSSRYAAGEADSLDYFGAGVGLRSAKTLATAIHGSYSFREVSNNEFTTTISIPIQIEDGEFLELGRGVCTCLSKYPATINKFAAALEGYVDFAGGRETELLLQNHISETSRIKALFLDYSSLETLKASISAASDCHFALIVSAPFTRETLHPTPLIRLSKEATAAQIRSATQLLFAFSREDIMSSNEFDRQLNISFQGLLFLLVDDNATSSALLGEGLRTLGAEVCSVASANECIALVKERQPDVLVLDWFLGDSDAHEILYTLEILGVEKRPTTVVLTSSTRAVVEQCTHSNVISQIIERPISSFALFKQIHDLTNSVGLTPAPETCEIWKNRSSLVDISVYEEMLDGGIGPLKVASLLRQFIDEIEIQLRILRDFENADAGLTPARILHSIKSVADTGGGTGISEFIRSSGVTAALRTNEHTCIVSPSFTAELQEIWKRSSGELRQYIATLEGDGSLADPERD